jgi:CHASE3 domain sensor protein
MNPQENQVAAEKKSFGPLVGIVVIIVVLALGALYVWGGKLSQSSEEVTETATTTMETASTTEVAPSI